MKKSLAIIGGGSAALMLAAQLDSTKFEITIYERNAALGRKFLVAGDGGLNLTHSEEINQFINRYSPSSLFSPLISAFNNIDLQSWLKSIGIETFIGSSKRVFPVKRIKPIDVLNSILKKVKEKGVKIKTQHVWKGFTIDHQLFFESDNKPILVKADVVVFALGGSSWKVTGSNGAWVNYFKEKKIEIIPFQPSNCACEIKWNPEFLKQAEGKSLKNVSLKCNGVGKKGEIVITRFGLEGGALYALSPAIRKQLNEGKTARISIDMKPAFSIEEVKNKLSGKGNKSYSKHLKDELNLTSVQINLLKATLTKEEFTNSELLAEKIKKLPLVITSLGPIDDAISTIGGIPLSEIDSQFQLKKLPGHYAIGEMLDWDAPTGGYLLQGCFSMGYYLARQLNTN